MMYMGKEETKKKDGDRLDTEFWVIVTFLVITLWAFVVSVFVNTP